MKGKVKILLMISRDANSYPLLVLSQVVDLDHVDDHMEVMRALFDVEQVCRTTGEYYVTASITEVE